MTLQDSLKAGSAATADQFVRSITLYKRRSTIGRLDLLLSAAALALAAAFWLSTDFSSIIYGMLSVFVVVVVGTILLSTHWSMRLKCLLQLHKVTGVSAADVALAVPAPHCGKPELCDVQFESSEPPTSEKKSGGGVNTSDASAWTSKGRPFIVFQQIKLVYNGATGTFHAPRYIDGQTAEWYAQHCRGLSDREVAQAASIYGANDLNIPIPSFGTLFEEHATAPFFVFQVFCVSLWLMDEYWYFSMFTLAMVIVFEVTVIKQRQRSLLQLRAMRRKPVRVYVLRGGKWSEVSSTDLVPGDVVSVKLYSSSTKRQVSSRGRNSGRGKQSQNVNKKTGTAPCDLLLLKGSCIVSEALLTGESIPLLKESISAALSLGDLAPSEAINILGRAGSTLESKSDGEPINDAANVSLDNEVQARDLEKHKKYIVWAGTNIVQFFPEQLKTSTSTDSDLGAAAAAKMTHSQPPDGGCIAVVLRTGFGTTQGQLMRTILFATDRVTSNSREAFVFLGVLTVFAILASVYVLMSALGDPERDQWKLFLHCIMIITSVIPPELPIQLSLAVTNSLNALRRRLVFCTEPFRIPFAGRVNVCCFDKTGTLTEDRMQIEGLAAINGIEASFQRELSRGGLDVGSNKQILGAVETEAKEFSQLPCEAGGFMATLVVAGCHSLINTTASGGGGGAGRVVGDPMEQEAFHAAGFTLTPSGIIQPASSSSFQTQDYRGDGVAMASLQVRILRRHAFSSSLKRMTTVIAVDESLRDGSKRHRSIIVSKGAPEVIEEFLTHKPEWYSRCHRFYTLKGCRVLALAWREATESGNSDARAQHLARSEVENNLRFAGFLMFKCHLKRDAKPMVKQLLRSSHRVMMITGDHPLTAVSVATKLRLLGGDRKARPEDVLILRHHGKAGLAWVRAASDADDSSEAIPYDAETVNMLCQGGNHLCVTGDAVEEILRQVQTKSFQSAASAGGTLRTRDERTCAALRPLCEYADVWARVSPWHKELALHTLNHFGSVTLMCGDGTNDVGALKQAHVGISIVNGTNEKTSPPATMRRAPSAVSDTDIVRFGDASIASPFTARVDTPSVALDIIRQGRCTLVTTVQMFKILALNSLILSYMLSALYLYGVKQGDQQATVAGLLIAGCFFFISMAKPQRTLHSSRPESNILSARIVLSVLVQFAVHITVLIAGVSFTMPFVNTTAEEMHPDGDFAPNVINTVVFLLSTAMQVSIFAVNYGGWPHMESLRDNKKLLYGLGLAYAIVWVSVSEVFPPINDGLELIALPSEQLRFQLFYLLVVDACGAFGAHWGLMKLMNS